MEDSGMLFRPNLLSKQPVYCCLSGYCVFRDRQCDVLIRLKNLDTYFSFKFLHVYNNHKIVSWTELFFNLLTSISKHERERVYFGILIHLTNLITKYIRNKGKVSKS